MYFRYLTVRALISILWGRRGFRHFEPSPFLNTFINVYVSIYVGMNLFNDPNRSPTTTLEYIFHPVIHIREKLLNSLSIPVQERGNISKSFRRNTPRKSVRFPAQFSGWHRLSTIENHNNKIYPSPNNRNVYKTCLTIGFATTALSSKET